MNNTTLVRELLQTRILAALFSETMRHELVLKGGMAMRTAVGSTRLTKDIDLGQSPDVPLARLRSVMEGAIKKALSVQLLRDVVVSEAKLTETTGRWKINGETEGGSKVQLTVEVSRRGLPPEKHIRTVNYVPPTEYGVPPTLIDVYDLQAMAATKVQALLGINRVAPRDLFDLNLLIEMQVTPPIELLAGMGEDYLTEALNELWSKIDQFTYEDFRSKIFPYVSEQVSSRLTEDAFEDMRLNVVTNVERWLVEARALAGAASVSAPRMR
jgi:predicted nucleotidyltransferase component of viral defense system